MPSYMALHELMLEDMEVRRKEVEKVKYYIFLWQAESLPIYYTPSDKVIDYFIIIKRKPRKWNVLRI